MATYSDAAAKAAHTRSFAMMVGEWRKAALAAGFTLHRVVVAEGADPDAVKPTLCIRPMATIGAMGDPPSSDLSPSHKRLRGPDWGGAPGAAGADLTTPPSNGLAAVEERERQAAAAAAAYLPDSDEDAGMPPADLGLTTPSMGGSAAGEAAGTPATGGTDASGGSVGSKRPKGRGSRSGAPKRSHWSDEDHNKLEASLRKYGWGKFGVIRTEFGLTSRLAASIERYAYRVKKQQPDSSLAQTWHDSHGKRMRNMENDGAPKFSYLPDGFKPLGAGKRKEATATYIAAAEKAGTLIPAQIIPVDGILPPSPPSASGAGAAAGATTGGAPPPQPPVGAPVAPAGDAAPAAAVGVPAAVGTAALTAAAPVAAAQAGAAPGGVPVALPLAAPAALGMPGQPVGAPVLLAPPEPGRPPLATPAAAAGAGAAVTNGAATPVNHS